MKDDILLNSGTKIPQIGLGLWQITDAGEMDVAVAAAIKAGYRHFDSAQAYKNEHLLSDALNKTQVRREEVFITTKIWTMNFLSYRVASSFNKSLLRLDTDYVDLLLLHFPVPGLRHRAWQRLEEIHKAGQAKAIGVSNYTIRHLKQLLKSCRIKPAVNQVEIHVFLQQPELIEFCKKNHIVVEAYSPLAHGFGMDNPTLAKLAKKHRKTSAQIMLRWCIERGTVPLPKSVDPRRIEENINVFDFELDEQDKKAITGLEAGYRTCWDPTYIP